MEETEEALAKMLLDNKVNRIRVESNAGGRPFARNVERILFEKYNSNYTDVTYFHQNKNKESRILTNSVWVMKHIYFPFNWRDRFPNLYKDLNKFQREIKANKHDDCADALTGVAETMEMLNR